MRSDVERLVAAVAQVERHRQEVRRGDREDERAELRAVERDRRAGTSSDSELQKIDAM